MKTRIIQKWRLLLVLGGLAFLSGNFPTPVAATPDDDPPAADPQPVAPPPAEAAAVAPAAVPVGVYLSPGAAGIAKLARAGVTEDVMTAYVGSVISPFGLGSEQIVYLNDLGVSGAVVKAMIQRDTELAAGNAVPGVPQPPLPAFTDPAMPAAPPDPGVASIPDAGDPQAEDDSDTPVYADDFTATDDADYFYNSMTPYGSWMTIPGYGMCWQPTVYTVNHSWQPYGDRGRWVSTDCGWYWQSDYTWGWAAFHYGRWLHRGTYGWVWVPDRTWGPAWVSWRHSAELCGWAPLPPSARFVPGKGLEFRHLAVGPEFEFGLRARHYMFIPISRMTDYSPLRYSVSSPVNAYQQTTVANHITVQNNRVVTHSIDPALVAAAAGTEPRRVRVQEVASDGIRIHTDQIDRQNGNLVIYRPQLPPPFHPAPGAVPTGLHPTAPARGPGAPRHSSNDSSPQPGASVAQSPTPAAGTIALAPRVVDDRPLPNMNFADRAAHPNVAYESAPAYSASPAGTYEGNAVTGRQVAPEEEREQWTPSAGSAGYAPPVLALPGRAGQTPPVNHNPQYPYTTQGSVPGHAPQAAGEPANSPHPVYVIPSHLTTAPHTGRPENYGNAAPNEPSAPVFHPQPPVQPVPVNRPPPVEPPHPAPAPTPPPPPPVQHAPESHPAPPAPSPSKK